MTIPRSLSVAAKLGRTSVAENTKVATPLSVGTINTFGASTATTYSLEGEYAGYFQLVRTGAATYEVALRAGVQLDYESLSFLSVTVRATSAMQPNHPGVTADFLLRITDAQDAPEIEGGDAATVQVAFGETAVTRVVATDQDGDALRYKIVGGSDRSLFQIDTTTGDLSFKQAPATTGRTTFNVIVEASDKGTPASSAPIWLGGKPGTPPLTDKQTITVEILESNASAPVLSGRPFAITSTGFSFTATDQDASSKLSVLFDGQAHAFTREGDVFTVDFAPGQQITSGQLSVTDGKFVTSVAHVALGTDGDDGADVANNPWTVSEHKSVVFGFGGNDSITTTGKEAVLVGGDGNDFLLATGGASVLYGGEGADTMHSHFEGAPMYGGNGNDIYVIDSAADRIYEQGQDAGDIMIVGSFDIRNVDITQAVAEGSIEAIGLNDGVSATMTLAQHALVVEAVGVNTVTLTDSGTLTASWAVENYVLADGDDVITFNAPNAIRSQQTVDLGDGSDTVIITPNAYAANTSNAVTINGFTAGSQVGGDVLDIFASEGRYLNFFHWKNWPNPNDYGNSQNQQALGIVESSLAAEIGSVANGGAVEQIIANRVIGFGYDAVTDVVFGISNGSGSIGFYQIALLNGPGYVEDLTTDQFSVQHIATLVGVNGDDLVSSNFS
ncbi:MAG: hypothetical protein EOO27_10670 [Comamonadaceae bacterium]|nr:MAG: hypothetical protein EOO27_10670 [Comamonadaceae bacterium]